MGVDGGMSLSGGECSAAGAPEATGVKRRVTGRKRWINNLLDLATEVVSEARAATSSHARDPKELTAFKGRMKDRKTRERTPSGT
jgi:hypothetical protein